MPGFQFHFTLDLAESDFKSVPFVSIGSRAIPAQIELGLRWYGSESVLREFAVPQTLMEE